MGLIIVCPLLVLFLATILCLLFFNSPSVQKVIALVAVILFFGATLILFLEVRAQGILSMQVGGWSAPFGITLVADTFSVCMLMITSIVSAGTFLFALEDVAAAKKAMGFYPVFLFLIFGVSGSFLTGDIFNLYVWYEIMLLASFVLISMGNTKDQLEGAVKYVILSFLASGFFLIGIGLLYKGVGSLNMASIATIMQGDYDPTLVGLSSVFFIAGFGVKSGLFPFFFWLPASYHTPPASISSLMAGLLTKVGVYTFIRMYTLIFNLEDFFTYQVLWWGAVLTMITGVLGAMAQKDFRKILSFHIISQIGYMIMGLVIYTPLAIAGAVFYIIHHIIVKSNLFLISGMVNALKGSYKLDMISGIYKQYPLIALFFIISAFSLAGIPPLSGFWSKFILVKAGIADREYLLVAVSLVVGLLTLFSMVKIWNQVFWEEDKHNSQVEQLTWATFLKKKYLMITPVVAFAMLTFGIGMYPAYLLDLAMQAAAELTNPQGYIDAVLNK